ncbi:MAG: hypothetical protein HUJ89_06645, partial [Bacteroidales bacterium]|nr:hypothetical protein [Bacteroidales bacterium]
MGQKLKKKTDTDGKVVTVKENTSEYECYEDFTKPCDMYKFQNELNIQIADLGTLLVTSTTDSTKKRIDNTKKDNGYFEHITNTTIPYLVQYNESFYNFLRRVCYRSGEYLFYEKGAFYIGRGKLGEKSKNIEYKTEDETGLMGNAEVANPSGLTNNHFIEVKSWDYRKIKYELDKGEKDCFKDGINVDEGNLLDKYNDEMSTKEFEKNEEATSSAYNKMDSFNDNFNRILRAQTFALANTGISSYHFLQGIMALSMRIVVSATVYGTMWEGKDLEGTYTKIWNINDTNSWKESGTDFYNTIQKNILEAHKGALNLKFTNKIEDVYVGQEVKLTRDLLGMGKQYIVNEVSLTFENKTFGYGLRVVPAENKVPDLHEEIPLTVTSGPQAAVVTNSLDPENMGRVRVRYFWQKLNELKSGSSTSPLMRVTSPMKTGSRGFSFVPSEGDFVMVDYEYGNMEKPYIIGALPNNAINSECNTGDRWETKNGWMWNNDRDGGLHLSSSISSINGHTIKFNDPKKSAALGMSPMGPMLNAALGLVECNKATSNGWPAGGITMSDTLGTYSIDMSADKREISISSPMGEVKINSLLGISIEAPKGDISIRGMNINIEAGNNLTISSANAFKKGLRKRSGKSVADYANFGLPILAPIAKMAFDFDFLRKLLQVFWCPIQGTIELYTPGNILLNQC